MVCFLLLVLASQNVAMSRSLQAQDQDQEQEQEQKNYYPPSTGASPSRRFYSRAPCSWLAYCKSSYFLPLQTPMAARRIVQLPPAAHPTPPPRRITMEAEDTALPRRLREHQAHPAAATITRLLLQEEAAAAGTLLQRTPRLRPLRSTLKSLPSSLVHASKLIVYCMYVIYMD